MECKAVTGLIVALASATRSGTIRTENGDRFDFSAGSVLGDFDTLAIGHRVSFELDRARPRRAAVSVFREPRKAVPPGRSTEEPPDLRFQGFSQQASVRSYRFAAIRTGQQVCEHAVTVDLRLMQRHGVSVQEAPALCLRKLLEDLKSAPAAELHELSEKDLGAFASARTASLERKRPKLPFSHRRGAPPPALS